MPAPNKAAVTPKARTRFQGISSQQPAASRRSLSEDTVKKIPGQLVPPDTSVKSKPFPVNLDWP